MIDAQQLRDVLFGEPDTGKHFHHGLATKLAPHTAVVVTSTISVADMAAIAQCLRHMQLRCVDAPVSGGPARARDGSMSMMLAANPHTLAQAQPALDAMSKAQTVLGEAPGTATKAKLLNNALAATHLHNHAQALLAAHALGLQPSILQRVVDGSSGQSWIGAHRGQRFLAGDTRVHARMALLAKDSALALDLLRSERLPTDWLLPAASAFAAACKAGWQDRDDSELILWLSGANPPPNPGHMG